MTEHHFRSAQLFEQARHSIPGGVNSPVRAFNGVGGTPRFIDHADGAYLYDVDGKAYVDYIAAHGGKNTIALSKDYSRDVVAPSLGNTTGETYYHLTLDSLIYNKGKLYSNGGNIFYAKEVEWNMLLLDLLNW